MPITGVGAAAEVDPVAALVAALNAATAATTTALAGRQVIAGTGLTGGGTLAADRTFTVDFASSGTSSSTQAVRADDSRLSEAGTPAGGNDAVCLGDSITAYGGSETMAQSWFNHLCIRSRGRIRWRGIYATGGFKIQDVITTWMPVLLATSPSVGTAFVMIGANDCSENGGVGFNIATKSALYESGIIQPMLAAGIRPVLCTITPNDGSTGGVTGISNNVVMLNQWIRTRARRGGFPVLEAHPPLVNIADGSMLTTFRGTGGTDHVHPSQAGHKAIAEFNLPGILTAFPPTHVGGSNFPDTYNLVGSGYGLFNADANSDGLADGWAVGGSPTGFTRERVTPTAADDLIGKWQQVTRETTDTNTGWVYLQLGSAWSEGDVLEYTVRVQTEGYSGSGASWATYIKPGNLTNAYGATTVWTEDVTDGTLTVRFEVPTGATSLFCYVASSTVPTSGTTKLRVGQATVRNLTTMGLDST